MDEMQYIGEHLVPRALGEIVTVIGFSAILFALISYLLALRNNGDRKYINTGRTLFSIHSLGIFGLIGLMFFVMFNRYYEYAYAFEHVSDDLSFKYMFSAFWEGQQGSFLLWMFWHIVIGFILIKKAKYWEPGVMLVLCIIQLWLTSMILGIYVPFTDFKIGDNPMLLLREVVDAPIFANEDYLSLLEGKGLNLLLQNYWNVIHPPVTFLGFASVSVPFAFALTGLFTRKYTEWMRPALPWVLFAVGILGVGILMGSAWAYEALTFGGYWAWDPVENMSLVPWIMLLAGLHAHLIAQSTGYSRRSVYLFYLLAFCLSIYSTYLVRSGALEDTSVHAFTEMGMGPQLTTFLLFFILGSTGFLIAYWKKIPAPTKEESSYSREFWMFIGLMILAISSILITYSTSLPVINKLVRLFNASYEGQVIRDANEHYNKYQLWIAVLISLVSGIAQWLRYKSASAPGRKEYIRMIAHVLLALVLSIIISSNLLRPTWPVNCLLFASSYGVIANIDYLLAKLKSNYKLWGSVLSHVGFGIMLFGIVISGINKRQISQNPTLMTGIFNKLDDEMVLRNVVLLKNEPIYSQGYMLEYERDTFLGTQREYIVSFKEVNDAGKAIDSFALAPNVIYSKAFDNIEVYHPSIKRSLTQDIFTRIATLPKAEVDPAFAQAVEDTLTYKAYPARPGDTIKLKNHLIFVHDIIKRPTTMSMPVRELDKVIGIDMTIINSTTGKSYHKTPTALLRGNLSYVLPDKLNPEEMRIKVSDSVLLPYLPYQAFSDDEIFNLKNGESWQHENIDIQFMDFEKNPSHPFYFEQEGDLAVGANILLKTNDRKSIVLKPVYIVRGNNVHHVDDYDPASGVLMRFVSLDPTTERITLAAKQIDPMINIYVAENVSRIDFLVLEALAFPGINLFWLGACLMLGGVFFSWAQRRKQYRA